MKGNTRQIDFASLDQNFAAGGMAQHPRKPHDDF